jgi:hypothetical protein
MKTCKLIPIVGLAITILSAACDKAKEAVTAACSDPNTCFKIDSLNAQLKKRLDGNCIGYGYMISAKDQAVTFNQGGFERMPQDAPQKAFSVFDRMNPASLSKTITAIALMHALNKHNISPSDSIYKYLPSGWTFGPLTKTITFKELLTHRAGIRFPNGNSEAYAGIRDYIAGGITQADKNEQKYGNVNYSIMRILIPIIDGQELTGTDEQLATAYGLAYEKYANDNVISKAGVPYAATKPDDENQNLCYQFPADGAKGTDFGDWTTINGGAGFNISVAQYATVVRTAFYTSQIIPQALAQTMRDSVWGFDYFTVGKTPFFKVGYVGKNGYFPGAGNIGEFNGEYMMFNNNVSVVLYVNSQLKYPNGIAQLIIDAFDASR